MRVSPKHCSGCKKQGHCADSRITALHVRRRYWCEGCDTKWTTYETRTERWDEVREANRRMRDELEEEQKFHKKITTLLRELLSVGTR